MKVWDVVTGQDTMTLKGHTGAHGIRDVAFSPDSARIASAGYDQTVKVWDLARGQDVFTLKGHTRPVTSVCFSPDGQFLASASGDQTVKLWDASTGEELRTLKGHTDSVLSVSFSPDGTRIVSASRDQTVKLWDVATGRVTTTLLGHTGDVLSVTFSPDGAKIASASQDNTIKLWGTATGQEILTLTGHRLAVHGLCFSPNGKRLASAGREKTVKLWDTDTGQEILTLGENSRGHFNSVSFSPDGKQLVSGTYTREVELWDTRPWTDKLRTESKARSLLAERQKQTRTFEDLQTDISSDKTLDETIRQQALDWSELFWNSARDRAHTFNESSWNIVRQPGLRIFLYNRALSNAFDATSLMPNDGIYLNTLGVASYRAQKYRRALAILTRSEKLNAPRFGGTSPYDLVFLAMTRFQLDEKKQAADLLTKVKTIAAQAKQKDTELDAFIEEAESLIEPAKKRNPLQGHRQ